MELRQALAGSEDPVVVYVLPDNQVNAKTHRFIEEAGLRARVRFAVDPGSRAIDRLGIRRPNPEAIEEGVPHPTTVLLDRQGVVRAFDLREDFHVWLAPERIETALAEIP